MGRTSLQDDPLDGTLALATTQTLTSVDVELGLVLTVAAVRVDVVVNAGAPLADGFAKQVSHDGSEALAFVGSERLRRAAGVEPSEEEGFIGVNVANPGHDGLIEEEGLE